MTDLKQTIADANRRAGLERQRAFGKKQVVKQSADAIIDNLCARAEELFHAFYKDKGTTALREAVQGLESAVRIAGKRVRG